MEAIGTTKGRVLKLVSESHSIVGVTLRADESIAIVRTVTNEVLDHLQGRGGRS